MSHTPSSQKPANPNPGWTDDDIKFGPLIKWTLSLWVVTGFTYLVLVWFLRTTRDQDIAAKGVDADRQLPPASGPLLQANPIREVDEYRAEQAASVTSYGVVNATSGVYRIPVDQAMRRLLEKNAFPAVAPAPEPK